MACSYVIDYRVGDSPEKVDPSMYIVEAAKVPCDSGLEIASSY